MLTYRRTIAKWIGFSALSLLAVIMQIMVFPRLSAVPNPLVSVAAVISLAVFAGVPGGAAVGFICGLLCDAMLPTVEAYFALTMMATGALTGFLCGKYMQRSFWSALVLCSVCAAVIEFFFFFMFYFITGRAGWSALYQVALPEVLASILCVPLLYPLFRGIARSFSEDS